MRQPGGTARVIRADCGTENGYVAVVQRFIRRDGEDHWAGMTVSSMENQFLSNE